MSSIKRHLKWLERVTYDLDTAKAMLETGRLVYVIFMCQQFHNLRRLAELSVGIHELNSESLIKLDFLSSYYINACYKEDLQQLSRGITETTAQDFIHFTEDLVKWLCEKMK